MKLTENLASVNIGGEYVPLSKGTTTVGKLKFDLALENKTDGLYSWVVWKTIPRSALPEFVNFSVWIW